MKNEDGQTNLEELYGEATIVGAGMEDATMPAVPVRVIWDEEDLEPQRTWEQLWERVERLEGSSAAIVPGVEPHGPRDPSESGPSLEDVWPDFKAFKLDHNVAEATLRNYRTALNAFGEWATLRSTGPKGPAASLTLEDLEDFQRFVAGGGSREEQLRANHHLKQLKSLWTWAAKRHRLCPPPLFPDFYEVAAEADKTDISREHLTALYTACDKARWPQIGGAKPAIWWRALIVMETLYGIDVQQLIPWEVAKVDRALRLTSFSFEPLCPIDYLEVHNEHGWFSLVRSKTKRKKPSPVYYPLTAVTRRLVDSLWPPLLPREAPPPQQFLPFPRNNKKVRETWRAIVQAAGVKPRSGGEYKLKHFRNVAANLYSTDVATYLLGHGARGHSEITVKHYKTALPEAVTEVNAAAVPECFRPSS